MFVLFDAIKTISRTHTNSLIQFPPLPWLHRSSWLHSADGHSCPWSSVSRYLLGCCRSVRPTPPIVQITLCSYDLSYPMVPILVMWNGNNIGGSIKRGVGIAMQVGTGNCGGIVASFMYASTRKTPSFCSSSAATDPKTSYRNQDKPRYLVGHGVLIG